MAEPETVPFSRLFHSSCQKAVECCNCRDGANSMVTVVCIIGKHCCQWYFRAIAAEAECFIANGFIIENKDLERHHVDGAARSASATALSPPPPPWRWALRGEQKNLNINSLLLLRISDARNNKYDRGHLWEIIQITRCTGLGLFCLKICFHKTAPSADFLFCIRNLGELLCVTRFL